MHFGHVIGPRRDRKNGVVIGFEGVGAYCRLAWLEGRTAFCEGLANQTEVRVKGGHYLQESSGPEIGPAVADSVRPLRRWASSRRIPSATADQRSVEAPPLRQRPGTVLRRY